MRIIQCNPIRIMNYSFGQNEQIISFYAEYQPIPQKNLSLISKQQFAIKKTNRSHQHHYRLVCGFCLRHMMLLYCIFSACYYSF